MNPGTNKCVRKRSARRWFVVLVIPLGCAQPDVAAPWWGDAPNDMVAADHAAASQAGAEILAMGGNAVDAAVATGFALSVVRQESCGLGGGGFMVIRRPGRKPVAIDFRESAPHAATIDKYLGADGRPIKKKTVYGPWAVAVPGTVRGLLHALERHGSGRVSRAQVLAPAIRLARQPLVVDRHMHEAMAAIERGQSWTTREANGIDSESVPRDPAAPARDAMLAIGRTYLRQGHAIEVGGTLDLHELSAPLEAIARDGAAAFYEGSIARQIAGFMQEIRGPLDATDLRDYSVRQFEPLTVWVGRFQFVTMPPPSSGGAVLLQAAGVLMTPADAVPEYADVLHPRFAHPLVESLKHGFADRARWLGDRSPDVMKSVKDMLSDRRRIEIQQAIDPDHTQPATSYGSAAAHGRDGGTSHFCVVDAEGGAVACTMTINTEFGSLLMVPGTGIVLNNEMDDFAVDTTTPNSFGLQQSERNLIAPGRRPLSSMTPTIILKDGRVEMVAGASGGPRIISATLQVILDTLWGGLSIDRAVARPRLHHQWLPDVVYVEPGFDPLAVDELVKRGHTIRQRKDIGNVQAIQRTAGGWRGACDPNKGGRPAGG